MSKLKNAILAGTISLLCLNCFANLSKEDEKAVQALQAAADELASDVAKVNKRHTKEYFKKRIGEIFVYCSSAKYTDKMACIKPQVNALTKE